jgi:hypothetical protein
MGDGTAGPTQIGAGGSSEFTDGGNFLYPADNTGVETILIGSDDAATGDILLGADGGATFNDTGGDTAASNFRIETDNQDHMFFVDSPGNNIIFGGSGGSPDATAKVLFHGVTGAATFNEIGDANADFRIESDSDAYMFFSDSSNNEIIIGASVFNGAATGIAFGAAGQATFTASLQVPQGTGPTVDSSGEIAVDTTDDQLVYFGAAKRVIPYEQTICMTVEDLAATDDNFPFFSPQDNITLVKSWCHCDTFSGGDCGTEADITFETVEIGTGGPTIDDVGNTVDCEDTVTGDTATTLAADNTVDALDLVRFDIDNAATTATYTICLVYTVDAQ